MNPSRKNTPYVSEQAGVSPTSGHPLAHLGPSTAAAISVLEREHEQGGHGDRDVLGQARPGRCPTTLPVSSWRGEAALIISSMTRLLFSAATPVATHIP